MMIKGDSSDTSCRAISIILIHWPESRYALYQNRQEKINIYKAIFMLSYYFLIVRAR